jgi:hypothetical protein
MSREERFGAPAGRTRFSGGVVRSTPLHVSLCYIDAAMSFRVLFGVIAPFAGAVTAPSTPTGVSPAIENVTQISRFTDFVLTWHGGGTGTVAVTFNDLSVSEGFTTCSASQSSGRIDVPAAAFAPFMSGDQISIELTVSNAIQVAAPNAVIDLTGVATVVTSNVNATLE